MSYLFDGVVGSRGSGAMQRFQFFARNEDEARREALISANELMRPEAHPDRFLVVHASDPFAFSGWIDGVETPLPPRSAPL